MDPMRKVVMAMTEYGRGFDRSLAVTWLLADDESRRTIETAFAPLLCKYAAMVSFLSSLTEPDRDDANCGNPVRDTGDALSASRPGADVRPA